MYKINIFRLPTLVLTTLIVLVACNANEERDGPGTEAPSKKESSHPIKDTTPISAELLMVKAQFVDFNLGDVPHFVFKDGAGKTWDFADTEDSTQKFAVELPEKQATTDNQGWAANKALKGKWFNIKYKYIEQPQYEGGPMTKAAIITEVTPVQRQ